MLQACPQAAKIPKAYQNPMGFFFKTFSLNGRYKHGPFMDKKVYHLLFFCFIHLEISLP